MQPTPPVDRTVFLIAGSMGCPAQMLGDELAKRRATCLYADTL
jgi:hypothetical protein